MQLFENVAHLASSTALYILGVGSTNGITFQPNSPEKLEKLTLGNTFFSLAKVKVTVDRSQSLFYFVPQFPQILTVKLARLGYG